MNQKQVNRIIKLLKEKEVSFDRGLSNDEVERIEERFNICFPDDLKLLLQTALPVSSGFVHWRYGLKGEQGKKEIEQKLRNPKEGILWGVKIGEFWLGKWGIKPDNLQEQKEIAERELMNVPQLIPIFAHRFISSSPDEIGNPVFSIYNTDIIHYGYDLIDYLANEFKIEIPTSYGRIEEPKHIDFWSDIINSYEQNNMKYFEAKRTVKPDEIDELNHVNNVMYVQWIQDIAGLHWSELIKENPQEDCIWVVVRHEIDYLRSAVLDDIVTLKTWVGETQGVKSVRHVEILKEDKVLVKAQTTWCLLDAKTHRPKRIDESVLKTLQL